MSDRPIFYDHDDIMEYMRDIEQQLATKDAEIERLKRKIGLAFCEAKEHARDDSETLMLVLGHLKKTPNE